MAYPAAAIVLIFTRYSPTFVSLGPKLALPAWLTYVTFITALPSFILWSLRARPGVGKSPPSFGLGFGESRKHALPIAVALVATLIVAFALSRIPEIRAYYPRYVAVRSEPWLWLPSTLLFALYGLVWETLFRGVLLIHVLPELGKAAIVSQALLFAIAHVDKPVLELWLSLPAGLFFGFLAFRTRSVLPGFFLHFLLSTSLNLFCVYG